MRSYLRITILIILFLPVSLMAQKDCEVKELEDRSYSGIVSYLKQHKFPSIDCFLHSLPKDIRALRTYAKTSISLQSASPMNPRAIVTSPEGSFSLTFNGKKGQAGFNEVELLAVDNVEEPKEWNAVSLRMSNNQLTAFDEKQKCAKCHGDPIRPIWNKYPEWPSLYGSKEDWMPDPSDPGKKGYQYLRDLESGRVTDDLIEERVSEREKFIKFREYAKDHSRYAALENISDESNPVYPYTENWRSRNYAFRPNLTIGTLLTGTQIKILKNRLKESRYYKSFNRTVTFVKNCAETTEVKKTFTRAEKKIFKDYEILTKDIAYKTFSNSMDIALMRLMGFKEHELTLLLKHRLFREKSEYEDQYENSFDFYSGHLTMVYDTFNHVFKEQGFEDKFDVFYMDESYEAQEDYYDERGDLLYSPARSRSTYLNQDFFRKVNELNIYRKGEYDIDTETFIFESWDKECQEMVSEVEQELLQNSYIQIEPSRESSKWPAVVNSCVGCHQGESRVGREIFFSDPMQIDPDYREALSSYLIDAMTDKDNSPAHLSGNRMPLGLPALTESEVKEIRDWIENGEITNQ